MATLHRSSLERFAATFRAGLFGLTYSLSKSHEKERWSEVFALMLSGFQMLSFPLNSSRHMPWNGISSVSQFSHGLDYITTERMDETHNPLVFQVFLGIAMTWTAIFLGLALTVAVNFAKDLPQNALVLRSLRHIARLSTSYLFLPFTAVLFRTLACPSAYATWMDTPLTCDSSERVVLAFAAAVLLVAFSFLALFVAATFVDRNPSSESWAAKGHGRIDVAMLSMKLFLVFLFNVVDEQVLGGAFATVLLIVVGLAWVGLYLRFMPFVHPSLNALETGFGASFLWSALSFAIIQISGTENVGFLAAFLVYFCNPLAFAFGFSLCLLRERVVAEWAAEDLSNAHDMEVWARAKLRKWRAIVDRENGAGSVPLRLGELEDVHDAPGDRDPSACPVVGAGSDTSKQRASAALRLLEKAESVYRTGFGRLPHDSNLFLFAACFFREHSVFHFDEALALSRAKKLDPAIDAQYHIYERTRQLREADKSGMSTVDRILFDQQVKEAKTLRVEAFRQLVIVWDTLSRVNPDGPRLQKAGVTLLKHLTRIEGLYAGLLRTSPNSTSVLRAYATFLMELANEPTRAMELLNKADRIEEANSKQRNRVMRHIAYGVETESQDLMDERSAVITISGDPSTMGEIVGVSAAACRTFGYASTQLVGQNVSLIVPQPFRAAHSAFLHRFARTGRSSIVSRSRLVFGAAKSGTIFPMWMQVSEAPPDEEACTPRFTAVMTPVVTSENHLFFGLQDTGFRIYTASPGSFSLLGLDPERIEGNTVSLLKWFPSLASSFTSRTEAFSGAIAAAIRSTLSATDAPDESSNARGASVLSRPQHDRSATASATATASASAMDLSELSREITVTIPPLLEARSPSVVPVRHAADDTRFVFGSVQVISVRGMDRVGLLCWHPVPSEEDMVATARGRKRSSSAAVAALDSADDASGGGGGGGGPSDAHSVEAISDSDHDLLRDVSESDEEDRGVRSAHGRSSSPAASPTPASFVLEAPTTNPVNGSEVFVSALRIKSTGDRSGGGGAGGANGGARGADGVAMNVEERDTVGLLGARGEEHASDPARGSYAARSSAGAAGSVIHDPGLRIEKGSNPASSSGSGAAGRRAFPAANLSGPPTAAAGAFPASGSASQWSPATVVRKPFASKVSPLENESLVDFSPGSSPLLHVRRIAAGPGFAGAAAGSVNSGGSKVSQQLRRSLQTLQQTTEPDAVLARKVVLGLVVTAIAMFIGAVVYVRDLRTDAKHVLDGMWASGRRVIAFQVSFTRVRDLVGANAGLSIYSDVAYSIAQIEEYAVEAGQQNTVLSRDGALLGEKSNAFDTSVGVTMSEVGPSGDTWRTFSMSLFEAAELVSTTMLRLARGNVSLVTDENTDVVNIKRNRYELQQAMNVSQLWHTTDVNDAIDGAQVVLYVGGGVFFFFAIVVSTALFIRVMNNLSQRVRSISSPLLLIPVAQAKLLQRRWVVNLQRAVNEGAEEDTTDDEIDLPGDAPNDFSDDDDTHEDRPLVAKPSGHSRGSVSGDSAPIAASRTSMSTGTQKGRRGSQVLEGPARPPGPPMAPPMAPRAVAVHVGSSGAAPSAAAPARSRRVFQETRREFFRGVALLTLPVLAILGWLVFLVVESTELRTRLYDASDRMTMVQQTSSLLMKYVDVVSDVLMAPSATERDAMVDRALDLDLQAVRGVRMVIYGGDLDFGVAEAEVHADPLASDSSIDFIMHTDACVKPSAEAACRAQENGVMKEGAFPAAMMLLSLGRKIVSGAVNTTAPGPLTDPTRLALLDRLRNLMNPHIRRSLRAAGENLLAEAEAVAEELTVRMTTVSIVFVVCFVLFAFAYYWPTIDELATPVRSAHGLLTVVPEDTISAIPELRAALREVVTQSQLGSQDTAGLER